MTKYSIDPIIFHVFYVVFFDEFVRREVNENPVNYPHNSPKHWQQQGIKKKYRIIEIWGNEIKDYNYLYGLKSEIKIYGSEGTISPRVLSRSLIYLDCKLAEDNDLDKDDTLETKDPSKNSYNIISTTARLEKFTKEYRQIIERIRNSKDAIEKNKITKTYVNQILEKRKLIDIGDANKLNRFYSLNGKFTGFQIQGKIKENVDLEIFTGEGNNLTANLVVHYEPDGKNDRDKVTFHVSGKLFNDVHLTLIYWNPEPSMIQNGVIRLTFSGNKRELNGHFWGYFDPIPESREKCEGILHLEKVD